MTVTAKVTCNHKQVHGEGDEQQATLGFCADYTDGRNKEWSLYTPSLDLRMTVRGSVADQFEQGRSYTLTFEATEAPTQETGDNADQGATQPPTT